MTHESDLRGFHTTEYVKLTYCRSRQLTTDEAKKRSTEWLVMNKMPTVAAGDVIFIGQYLFTGSETSVYLLVQEVPLPHRSNHANRAHVAFVSVWHEFGCCPEPNSMS